MWLPYQCKYAIKMTSQWGEKILTSHINCIYIGGSGKTQSGLIPRTLETMSLTWWDGLTLGLLGIVSSTYGHCRKYLMWEFFFFSWGRDFLFCNSSVFSGRRTGGRSGHILILSWRFLSFRAPSSHLLRWLRSRKRKMIPASFLRDSRWHAAKSASAASSMSRCCQNIGLCTLCNLHRCWLIMQWDYVAFTWQQFHRLKWQPSHPSPVR